jgi:hypothetical protein
MSKIMGADLKPGQVIKAHGRLYTLVDIDPDDIGSKFDQSWWVRDSSGRESEIRLFVDSEYDLRKDVAPPRPRIVKVSLPPELVGQLDRARVGSGETAEQAIVRIVRQYLNEWGG